VDDTPAAVALRRLSLATNADYQLVRRLAGGETGAHEVRGPDGARLVVKWERDPTARDARRQGVALTARLHGAGWPVPEQWVVEDGDCTFVLQQLVAGANVDVLSHDLLDELLELDALRRGLGAGVADATWPEHLVETLVTGGDGYCVHASLRAFDARTAALLDRIRAIGAAIDTADFAADDVVHWDLHPGNLLQIDGHLSAVVDNDFVTVGDGRFDLVTLVVASEELPCEDGVRERLTVAAFDGLAPIRREAYVAHLLLRVLDWAIRKDRADEIDFWLDRVDSLPPA
jgi:aminoglycoside phosphotransferase (APT) family kinase protein